MCWLRAITEDGGGTKYSNGQDPIRAEYARIFEVGRGVLPRSKVSRVDSDRATSPSAPLVVMEGHVRLTAYALAFDCLLTTIEVIVWFSLDFPKWGAHGTV